MSAERVNVFFVLSAEEGPFKVLVAADKAGGIGLDLALDDALQDGKDLTSHLSSLRDRELEEKHAHVPIDLMSLRNCLTVLDQLHLRVVLHEKLLGYFCLFRDFEPVFDPEDQVDQAHDESVFWVECQHLEEDLTRVHLL